MNESIETPDFSESKKLKEINGLKLVIFYTLSAGILIPLLFVLAGFFYNHILSCIAADSMFSRALTLLRRTKTFLVFMTQIALLCSVKFSYLIVKHDYSLKNPTKYIRSASIIYLLLIVQFNLIVINFFNDIKFENIWGIIIFSVICVFNFNFWTRAYFNEWKDVYDEKNDPDFIDKRKLYVKPLSVFVTLFILSALLVFPIIMIVLINYLPKLILGWITFSEITHAGAYVFGVFLGSSFIINIFQKKFTYPNPKTAEVYVLVISNTLIFLALAISLTFIKKPDPILYITSALIAVLIVTVSVKLGFPKIRTAPRSAILAQPVMTAEPQLSVDKIEDNQDLDENNKI